MWDEGCAATAGAVDWGMIKIEMQAGVGLDELIPAFSLKVVEKY